MGFGVQQLDPNYIKTLDSRELYSLEEQGIIKKQGGKYYVAGNNVSRFAESCFVKDGDNVKTFMVNRKGTIVERTTPQPAGKPVGEPVATYSVSSSMIIERMGLIDENLKTEFLSFLSNKEGLTLGQDGNITFDKANATALNDALKEFANLHKKIFVNPNAPKYIEFTPESDPEMITELQKGDNPAIGEAVVSGDERRYPVTNVNALESTLNESVGDISYDESSRSATVEAGLTTTTTTEEGIVDVPDNLRDSRSARRQLRKDAADSYADMVANADDYQRDAIDLYIAERRYSKKIDKKMEEMQIYKANIGGKRDRKIQRDDADIIQMYINQYAKEEDRAELNNLVTRIQNSNNPEDQQAILDALKSSNIVGISDKFENLSPDLKRKGALICMAKANGYEPKAMLRLMATYEVMNERTSDEVIADDKWFIKEQSKDFVKNQQAQQDVPNTEVHFSRKSRRHAPEDGRLHTDIGRKGRALVKACPEMLCDEITDPSQFRENDDEGIFKAEMKDGTIKYFKFNSEKWKTFMGICCDPSNATDDAMKVLFGDNETAKDNFLKDMNMTLQEGRSILTMNLPSSYGETGTLKFENIVGNTNSKIGNRELNTLRDMVESAGYSVDKNTTTGKRMLHVLKNAGLGAGMGFLTGGMGSLLSGSVNVAGMTAPELINVTGPVALEGIVTVNGSLTGEATLGYHDNVVTTDYYTDPYGTTSITHETPVSGTTTGSVTLSGDVTGYARLEGDATLTTEHSASYSDSGNNHLRTATNAGILGGIAGTVRGLATTGGVQAKGRNTDDVFNLTRQVQTTDESDETLSLEIPQFTTIEKRSGTKEIGQEIPKLKAVRYRGPEAYSRLYKYENGDPVSPRDFAKAYQDQIGGIMTDYNFFVYPELTVPGKGKIVPVDNYKEEYQKIKPGTSGGVRGKVINPQGKKTVKATGTIKA